MVDKKKSKKKIVKPVKKTSKKTSIKNVEKKILNLDMTTVLDSRLKIPIKPADQARCIDDFKKYLMDLCNGNSNYNIFFTSGEIESNTVFLCSAVNAYKKIRSVTPHIIISAVESETVLTHARSLKDSGQIELTIICPNIHGCVLSEHVKKALKPNTCCVLITYINRETGSVNNIEKICSILHEQQIPLHCDSTYLFGRHKLDLVKTNIDSATISFDVLCGTTLGAIVIKKDLLDGYKLYEHSITLTGTRKVNVHAVFSAYESIKGFVLNRKQKNANLLKCRNEIINKLGDKNEIVSYSDFINSDNPPLEEKKKTKIIVIGPPVKSESYYTPSILSIAVAGKKKVTGEFIKNELEQQDIIIGVPNLDGICIYDNIKMPEEIQKNIIRISLPDDINITDINKFVTKLNLII